MYGSLLNLANVDQLFEKYTKKNNKLSRTKSLQSIIEDESNRTIHAYIRVSSEKQILEGSGLESQEYAIKDFIKKNDIKGNLVLYIDKALSGKLQAHERPKLNELLQAIKSHDIVLSRIDRISRNSKEYTKIITYLDDKNVQFMSYFATDNISLNKEKSSMDILLADIGKYVAQKEREKISENSRRGVESKKAQNKQWSARIPYGYKVNEKKELIVNEEEQTIIKLIMTLYPKLKKFSKVANYLNEHNYTKRTYTIKKEESKFLYKPLWYGNNVFHIYHLYKTDNLIPSNHSTNTSI